MASRALAVILGGGRGERLHPLTQDRAKPAVPLGGSYRLIDIPVSNCIHSGMHRIFVITQFNSASLNQHLALTYQFDDFRQGFVEVLAATQTPQTDAWYDGTADAIRRNLWHFNTYQFSKYLILAGDHLYKMNYADFIAFHEEHKAEITLAVTPVARSRTGGLGLVRINRSGRVTGFVEKPKDLSKLKGFAWYGDQKERRVRPRYLASMGIYVFRRTVLERLLRDASASDFGAHVLPRAVQRKLRVFAYPFAGYWRDIGTIRSFYDANLQLTHLNAPFSFHRDGLPVFTRSRFLPGARIIDSTVDRAIVAPGATLQHCRIESSVVGLRSTVREGSVLLQTVMMGADMFEAEAKRRTRSKGPVPKLGIGKDCHIESAIVDKNARIGNNVRIVNEQGVRNADGNRFCIRDGIVIIPKNTVIPDDTVI